MKNSTVNIEFVAQQYNSKKCGQTCLSMITGKAIDDICKELGKHWETDIYNDLQPFLNNNNFKTRLVSGSDITYQEIPNQSILLLKYPSKNGHFVIKYDNKYYDPSVGIIQQFLAHEKITNYLTFEKLE